MTENALAEITAPTTSVGLAAPPVEPAPPAEASPSPVAEVSAASRPRVDIPEPARPIRIMWGYAIALAVIHALALLACFPWFFSWTGVVLCVGGVVVCGTLGMNLCFHRLLTHQGLTLPKWLEHACAILGVCCLMDTPARWVAIHRMHHKHADHQDDPHTPLVNFLWSYVGWVVVGHREHSTIFFYEQYAKDVLRDPFYFRLERRGMWWLIYLAHAVLFYALGLAIGWWLTGRLMGGVQFGASVLVWGVLLRTLGNWHITWAVNSITHMWGYRNYPTPDDSTNHWLLGVLALGEGWHNNHHADQRSAVHGHQWWEFDLTYQVIRVLEWMGLAKNVVRPRVWKKNPLPATAD